MAIGLYFNPVPVVRRDRLVVRTLRCGRSNPGSNPGHGTFFPFLFLFYFSHNYFLNIISLLWFLFLTIRI